jgi:hypothetical protein
MSQTSIRLAFADGEYDFRLGLAQINEIQNRCGVGIGAVYARVLKGRFFQVTPDGPVAIGDPSQAEYRIEDLLSTVRQGLIGGGKGMVDGQDVAVDATRADQLVKNYIAEGGQPIKLAWELAAAILSVAIEGYDPPGEVKKKGAAGKVTGA